MAETTRKLGEAVGEKIKDIKPVFKALTIMDDLTPRELRLIESYAGMLLEEK